MMGGRNALAYYSTVFNKVVKKVKSRDPRLLVGGLLWGLYLRFLMRKEH